eukprot:scaffold15250_cov21-Tisochrysis_lutea.AAC.1
MVGAGARSGCGCASVWWLKLCLHRMRVCPCGCAVAAISCALMCRLLVKLQPPGCAEVPRPTSARKEIARVGPLG